jgi:hypothetical protein
MARASYLRSARAMSLGAPPLAGFCAAKWPVFAPPLTRVRIISDNQQYSTYECTSEEVNVVGRVRWYGREM